ncbi:MAG: DNA repair protein RecN [Clostridia bacterium]|nr:DNA repair protein RecN [Clostridia bacterium]
MLETLYIENVAVIESAEISFTSKFNVLTGETGAGKSIIIDSINAILGERTPKDIIRNGCDYALITAEFSVSKSVEAKLIDLGYSCDEGTLIISRKLSLDGRNNVRINGKPATVSILREIGVDLINIHGQHDSQHLLNFESHLNFIDALADNQVIYDEYITNYKKLVEIKHKIKDLTENNNNNADLKEMLEFQIKELEEANIKPGEKEKLEARRNIIKNAEKIQIIIDFAKNSLNDSDNNNSVCDMLRISASNFEGLTGIDERFKAVSERFKGLEIESRELLNDIVSEFNEYDFDEYELDEIEKRLDIIYGLSLKYGSEENMLVHLAESKEKLDSIVNFDNVISELENEFTELLDKTKKISQKLTDSRVKTAKKFDREVAEQLQFLNMPFIKFTTEITGTKLTSKGAETLEFLISTNPGEPPKPLIKIASGGELSRIMLAIKTVLSGADDIETLIFDEIDSGISGNAAQKVAVKLQEIANDKQVICVTHLAQIAALAESHYVISKSSDSNKSVTNISRLDYEGRVNELSRIISGGEITENIRNTAIEMLNKSLT